jgi:hypothetical protein
MPMYILAQEHFTGCLLDEEAYNAIPQKKENLTRDYEILPSSYSLKQYCPTPNNQSNYGTCTGWASAYAARTIAEAVAYGWKDKEKITLESFSPIYIYAQITERNDDCKSGTYIHKALEIMKNEGVAKYNSFNVKCASYIPYSLKEEAILYKIDDYYTLFYSDSPYSKKINETKKVIYKDNPVIIAMKCYGSFSNATDIWNGRTDSDKGYHAMCVIGYDDNKNGGSFQLINSWGLGWGNGGFTWVTYDDYYRYVNNAYAIYVKKKELPKPKPDPQPTPEPIKLANLGGEIRYHLTAEGKKGTEMHVQLYSEKTIPYYRMQKSYESGSRYRIYISNNEPAYVYVIGSDLKNSVSLAFPPDDKTSALIDKSSNIAIPDETWSIEMDNTIGTDYVCVLYSENALPIHNIVKKIKEASGNFYDKIKFTLSNNIVPAKEIIFSQNVIRFNVKGTKKTVVPVIVEIEHK